MVVAVVAAAVVVVADSLGLPDFAASLDSMLTTFRPAGALLTVVEAEL